MSDNDKTLESIKSGKGLPPLPSSSSSDTKGVSSEHRGGSKGISVEIFTLDDKKKG